MIIGTIALLSILFGGGDFSFEKVFKPFVKDVVTDNQRYDQIVESFKKADDGLEAYRDEVQDVWVKDLKILLSDYDATEDDLLSFRRKVEPSRKATQRELLDVRFGIVKLMSEDEWNSMFEAMIAKTEQ